MSVEDSPPRRSVLLWYAGGALAAVAIGFVAARLNLRGFAPIGLLSIGVGCVLGAILGALAALAHVHCRTRLILGTFVLATLTVFAEHAWLYHDFRRQWHEARMTSAEVALFRSESPWSPVEYFTREASAGRIAHWVVDAALIVATAIITVVVVHRSITRTRVASDAAK